MQSWLEGRNWVKCAHAPVMTAEDFCGLLKLLLCLMTISVYVFFSAMEELLAELRVFLELLDREYLTAGVREKKLQILNILHRVLATRGESKAPLASHLTFDLSWTIHTAPHLFIITHAFLESASINFFFSDLNVFNVWFALSEPSCKTEIHTSLPAPPQMPLPEIPHPWMVRCVYYYN